MSSQPVPNLWDDLGLWPTRRFDRCILHIGTEKTGTTSLQRYLCANRAALLRAGFFVPASLSPYAVMANHERLTTYALADTKLTDGVRLSAGIASEADLAKHRAAILCDLTAEAAALPKKARPVLLLSNEHCHSRLTEHAELRRLQALLARFAHDVTIVVYLRPQHDLAVSLYDEALKSGHHDIPTLPQFDRAARRWVERDFFDYDLLLSRWADVFGRASVQPRIFDRTELRSGSVIDDFIARLPADLDAPVSRDSNATMDADRQQVLNVVNRIVHRRGAALPRRLRAALITQLQRASSGAGQRPTRAAAMAFHDSFAVSNERLRAAWFPQRETLFQPDFARYPETAPVQPPEAATLAAMVIAQQVTIEELISCQAPTPA